jgi:DNA-binding transcriptional ArsR family regulator
LNIKGDGSSRPKERLFEAIAVIGKAFASPVRLELVDLLAQAPRTVEELARVSGQSTANASQHLEALHAAGMVTRAREGTRVRYAIAGDEALRLWLALRDASVAQLAQVERAAGDYLGAEVEAIGRGELIARLGRGDVVLVDVRPRSPPATSTARVRSRWMSSSGGWWRFRDREVVAYCRGPYCAYAHEAVRRLREAGRSARRLDHGWPEWRLAAEPSQDIRAA